MLEKLKKPVFIMACLLLVTQSPFYSVNAAQLTNRSVAIGSSTPSAFTSYVVNFNITTVALLGSIEFEFCANDPLVGQPCTAPAGFNASSAVLAGQSGEIGFIIDPVSTSNRIVISRAPVLSSATPAIYTFTGITNPNYLGTIYARVATYNSADGTGARTDSGGLAFSTAQSLSINSFVPPYLTFCVGVTVAGDCSVASGEQLDFGELVKSQAKFVTSQFAAATNDFTGYSITVNGLTMTSGSNIIQALNSPTTSLAGISQFGMNLRSNNSPSVGADPSGVGSAVIAPDYSQQNRFVFKNQVVASSPYSTDFNLFTVSYVINVSAAQPPGVYNTTLTYVATAAF